MGDVLTQLGINQTIYIQFAVFTVIFLLIPPLFFKPFQKLIDTRHQKTVADKERAEEFARQASAKFEEFRTRMNSERANARAEHERVIAELKSEESKVIGNARDEAKKITQSALETIQNQSATLKRALETDVEGLALQISELLTKR